MFALKNICIALAFCYSTLVAAETHQELLQQLTVPKGFKLSVYADNVANARAMALAENGTLFVGSAQEGKVYALTDDNQDGIADRRYIVAENLYLPVGVAYNKGSLYVTAVNRIVRFDNINQHLGEKIEPVVITDKLPSDKHHGWKYLRFGADGKLYTAVGAPCNICEPKENIYGSLVRLNADGSELEILANGIRNTVGFDWQPDTHALFFNDNGRDHLGDDSPADELNVWTKKGEHFGYPYCHGGDTLDPEFGANKKCADYTAPVWQYQAHIAPLGMRFYTGRQFPSDYHKQLLVAQHGSWNRTEPQGYQVVLIKFKDGKAIAEQSLISGWLTPSGNVLGRPVDILTLPDGSVLISDDQRGMIYKLTYNKP